MAFIIFVKSAPAGPTNGTPCSSSSRPGPSPMNISSAFVFPAPNTTLRLLLASGQAWHDFAVFFKVSQSNCAMAAIGGAFPRGFWRVVAGGAVVSGSLIRRWGGAWRVSLRAYWDCRGVDSVAGFGFSARFSTSPLGTSTSPLESRSISSASMISSKRD